MNILVLGASGFLGRHLTRALRDRGYRVIAGSRTHPQAPPPALEFRQVDVGRALDAHDWLPVLQGIDVVVNAVGIFRESGGQRFDQLHDAGPRALFDACVRAGVRRVVQVSALGADADAQSAYHLSKRAADEHLLALPLDAVVVQPSLIYGAGGTSATLFGMLASLPLVPEPALGAARVQPIHVDDVTAAIVALVEAPSLPARRLALVGPRALSWREFMEGLRSTLGLPRGRYLPIPASWAAAMARVGDRWPGALLDTEAWRMLQRGNSADAGPLARLLGRMPRDVSLFAQGEPARAQRLQAQLSWLLPIVRLSLAAMWIVTGLLSLGIYPVAASYALLERTGVPEAMQPLALYGAACLDIALGVLALMPRRARWLWAAQAGLILAYTGIITWRLPEFWLHPYGPILKNVPLLALLWLLHELERPWNTR